jgi:ATP-dependent RNA helicase DDX10/DBP4
MLEKIRKRTLREIPPPGVYGFLSEKAPDGTEYIKSKFTELPISPNTQQALTNHGFTTMTPVQRSTIPHALGGRDILGTAMTGSGKTLSFLIPALERLYREQWNMMDGLGVLIIEPTRELAL